MMEKYWEKDRESRRKFALQTDSTCQACTLRFKKHKASKGVYCSQACYFRDLHRNKKRSICKVCRDEFIVKKACAGMYCSQSCAIKGRTRKRKRQCATCTKTVVRKRVYDKQRAFCSLGCRRLFKRKVFLSHREPVRSLREQGLAFREIAKRIGISYGTAINVYYCEV